MHYLIRSFAAKTRETLLIYWEMIRIVVPVTIATRTSPASCCRAHWAALDRARVTCSASALDCESGDA